MLYRNAKLELPQPVPRFYASLSYKSGVFLRSGAWLTAAGQGVPWVPLLACPAVLLRRISSGIDCVCVMEGRGPSRPTASVSAFPEATGGHNGAWPSILLTSCFWLDATSYTLACRAIVVCFCVPPPGSRQQVRVCGVKRQHFLTNMLQRAGIDLNQVIDELQK